jgi:2,4-diaminopentanoate dehydrogenase
MNEREAEMREGQQGLRVGFYGAGAMASEIASVVTARGHELVAALDVERPSGLLGEVYVADAEALLAADMDVVVHATPRDSDLRGQILEILDAGFNVVSISGIAHLRASDPAAAEELDAAARARGVSVMGSGINPGFVMDVVPIFFAGGCTSVSHITARRVTDLTPYGGSIPAMYGIGLSEEEFHEAIASGRVGLHHEILQSLHMIADVLRLPVTEIEEEKLPIMSDGKVAGFRHVARGKPSITLELLGVYGPEGGGSTTVEIEGDPDISVEMSGGVTDRGGRVVAARVANTLGWLVDAPPGLRSPAEAPLAPF